jgi:hypothetical protein
MISYSIDLARNERRNMHAASIAVSQRASITSIFLQELTPIRSERITSWRLTPTTTLRFNSISCLGIVLRLSTTVVSRPRSLVKANNWYQLGTFKKPASRQQVLHQGTAGFRISLAANVKHCTLNRRRTMTRKAPLRLHQVRRPTLAVSCNTSSNMKDQSRWSCRLSQTGERRALDVRC